MHLYGTCTDIFSLLLFSKQCNVTITIYTVIYILLGTLRNLDLI